MAILRPVPVKPEKASNRAFQGFWKTRMVGGVSGKLAKWDAIATNGRVPMIGITAQPKAAVCMA
jgi:hypothetical protein